MTGGTTYRLRILLLCIVFVSLLCCMLYKTRQSTITTTRPVIPKKSHCPSVLDYMMVGSWVTRDITQEEDTEINEFLFNNLSFLKNGSRTFQKEDLTCGNISYYQWMSNDEHSRWFRVLCEPKGTTPCCYNNHCEARSITDCKCDNCYDLRPLIHAEYSKWVPKDPRCAVKNYTVPDACELLDGGTLHFYGDSLVRQLFIALVIILKGDYLKGGLQPDAPQSIKEKCAGMYVFPTSNCRSHLDVKPVLCGGRVKLEYYSYANTQTLFPMLKTVRQQLIGVQKSFLLFGSGIWEYFNLGASTNYALNLYKNLFHSCDQRNGHWPHVVWSSFHYLGMWKQPLVDTVNNDHILKFNSYLKLLSSRYGVPVFDTVNITRGVRSVDGTHYGPGINFLKAQILLNYIAELHRRGIWM